MSEVHQSTENCDCYMWSSTLPTLLTASICLSASLLWGHARDVTPYCSKEAFVSLILQQSRIRTSQQGSRNGMRSEVQQRRSNLSSFIICHLTPPSGFLAERANELFETIEAKAWTMADLNHHMLHNNFRSHEARAILRFAVRSSAALGA